MKPTRSLLLAAFLFSAGSLAAQSVDFILVAHRVNYVQTGATVSDVNLTSSPYAFSAFFEGAGMTASNPVTGVSITLPNGTTTHALSFSALEGRWGYENSTAMDMTALTTAFPTGNYTFTPTGGAAPYDSAAVVSVGSYAGSLMQAPFMTLTGGTWVGSNYTMTPGSALSVTFNPVFAGGTPATEQAFRYEARISGPGLSVPASSAFVNWDVEQNQPATLATTPATFTVGAGQLGVGTFTLTANYEEIGSIAPFYAGALGVAMLQFQNSVTIVVASPVPEPATYALALGGLAIGFAAWRRRRVAV